MQLSNLSCVQSVVMSHDARIHLKWPYMVDFIWGALRGDRWREVLLLLSLFTQPLYHHKHIQGLRNAWITKSLLGKPGMHRNLLADLDHDCRCATSPLVEKESSLSIIIYHIYYILFYVTQREY